jgi:RHS repeat-associated protein
VDDTVTGWLHDSLNRLTSATPASGLRVAGSVNEPARIAINGASATVDSANIFSGTASVTSGSNTFTVAATDYSGNSLSKSYTINATGQTGTFTYDSNGNLVADGTRTFEWDAENRLVSVVSGTQRSEFTYDGVDRRIRIVEKDGAATVSDHQLFWAGTNLIEDRSTSGRVDRFFTHGEQHDGVARYVTRDHLGSVRELLDSAGTVVARYDYDPWGRSERIAGDEDSEFRYAGYMHHAPSGLALTLYRAYAPSLGRWISEDPLGMNAGPNFYAYVLNGPLTGIDPTGLIRWNSPPPKTVPVTGETLDKAKCVEKCLQGKNNNPNLNLLLTGGQEKSGHSRGSHHYLNRACDIAGPRTNPVADNDVFACGESCGFAGGQFEDFENDGRDHWHLQLTPGNGVPPIEDHRHVKPKGKR